jgi:hypothetical protein
MRFEVRVIRALRVQAKRQALVENRFTCVDCKSIDIDNYLCALNIYWSRITRFRRRPPDKNWSIMDLHKEHVSGKSIQSLTWICVYIHSTRTEITSLMSNQTLHFTGSDE